MPFEATLPCRPNGPAYSKGSHTRALHGVFRSDHGRTNVDRQTAGPGADNHAITRAANGKLRRKADAARDKRMHGLIEKGVFPYTPAVQSWVSVQLDTPFTQLKDEDVKGLLKK